MPAVRGATTTPAWWRLAGGLGVSAIISYGTSQYLFGVLIAPWQRDLGAGPGTLAAVYSAGMLMSGLFGLLAGRLLDRFGPRGPMVAGSAASGAALLAMSTVHDAWWLFPLWSGLHALGMGLTYYPVTFAVLGRWFPEHRASALGVLSFVGGTSSLVFVPLAGWLADATGWRATLVVMGLVQLLVALPLHALLLRHGRPWQREDGPAPAGSRREVSRVVRSGWFWGLTLGGALIMLAAHVVFVYLVPYLASRGLTPVAAAAIGGLIGVSSPPSRLALAVLTRIVRAARLLVAVVVFAALGVALVVLAAGPVAFGAGVIMFGAGYGAQGPLRALVLSHEADPDAYGTLNGLQNLPAAAFGAGGPLLAGGMLAGGWGYDAVFAGVIAVLVLGAVSSASAWRRKSAR
ncbi:MFS transporter [Amycolatopsis sp. MtRt-6]|uniref:MFS transporter n=1 Tax=Amycolatopsis sp. MtRt-6 TaxID=2792782 RepID=UPI001A8FEE7A|nr:MFS transporter [Amycolatopsis sp. MtRt-6]